MTEDILQELGALALGSRLKRLGDALLQDGLRIYELADVGFQPRWFPVFVYLNRRGPTSITDLAKGIGVSHPGVNKVADEMIAARLLAPYRDRQDKRKRLLALTSLGKQKFIELEPIWRDIRQAVQGLVDDSGKDFLTTLSALEVSANQEGIFSRYQSQRHKHRAEIEIVEYEPRFREAFSALNEAWIKQFFTLEEADLRVLNDPENTIIATGGDIFFAIESQSQLAIGTCALIKLDHERAELAKMAVAEQAKGRHIGLALGQAVIDRARAKGFKRLVLESNRRLKPAITLYEKLGFVDTPFPHPSDYSRADIYMAKILVD